MAPPLLRPRGPRDDPNRPGSPPPPLPTAAPSAAQSRSTPTPFGTWASDLLMRARDAPRATPCAEEMSRIPPNNRDFPTFFIAAAHQPQLGRGTMRANRPIALPPPGPAAFRAGAGTPRAPNPAKPRQRAPSLRRRKTKPTPSSAIRIPFIRPRPPRPRGESPSQLAQPGATRRNKTARRRKTNPPPSHRRPPRPTPRIPGLGDRYICLRKYVRSASVCYCLASALGYDPLATTAEAHPIRG
jgi:hypothetical protein